MVVSSFLFWRRIKPMATQETKSMLIRDDEKNSCAGMLHYIAFTPTDRTKRAAIMWTGCWIAAGIAVFIPLAHFFLVPAFLIAGPILFFQRSKQKDAKEKVTGTCPRCHQEIEIKLEATDQLPKWVYCPKCDGSLDLNDDETQDLIDKVI